MFIFVGYKPTSEKAGSQDTHIFSFSRYCKSVFHSAWINLHCHQQYIRVLVTYSLTDA